MLTFGLFLQLPLFKGVEMDELFSLIPKVNLDFENYQPGDVVFDRRMEPRGLVYLLKGSVNVGTLEMEQVLSGPALLSYTGLFGTNRRFSMDAVAKEVCSTLNIETKSLLFLLRNNPVFLSNYLDLLSDTIDELSLERTTKKNVL